MDPTHSFGELLFYDIKYSAIAYLTLQNDSNTACNIVSLILNASILQHEIHPGSYFMVSWDSFPFSTWRNLITEGLPNVYFIILTVLTEACPDNGIANTYVYYRWDRIAWCIRVIFQREVSTPTVILQHGIRTPGVISSYFDLTPLCNQKRDNVLNGINPAGDISLYHQRIHRHCPENGIANAYIHYRWDRIAWSVGVIFS